MKELRPHNYVISNPFEQLMDNMWSRINTLQEMKKDLFDGILDNSFSSVEKMVMFKEYIVVNDMLRQNITMKNKFKQEYH